MESARLIFDLEQQKNTAMSYYLPVPRDVYLNVTSRFPEFHNYTDYNYLSGVSSIIKTRHFEWALKLTRKWHHIGTAVDFGCADGPFSPSLAKYFKSAVAVEPHKVGLEINRQVSAELGIENISFINNTVDDELSTLLPQKSADVIFVLEVLEHIGDRERYYESKVELLQSLTRLLKPGGVIVVSVPKMVGPMFLVQRIGLRLLGLKREEMSMHQILKASFLYDVSELEKTWVPVSHLGFNQVQLARNIRKYFRVIRHKGLMFQDMFVIGSN